MNEAKRTKAHTHISARARASFAELHSQAMRRRRKKRRILIRSGKIVCSNMNQKKTTTDTKTGTGETTVKESERQTTKYRI